jgi:hypothetical protein
MIKTQLFGYPSRSACIRDATKKKLMMMIMVSFLDNSHGELEKGCIRNGLTETGAYLKIHEQDVSHCIVVRCS